MADNPTPERSGGPVDPRLFQFGDRPGGCDYFIPRLGIRRKRSLELAALAARWHGWPRPDADQLPVD